MNLLEEFSKEFIKRHDFYSEDLDNLFNKWPKTSFKNIPEAWIIPIDEMLLKLSNINVFPIYVEQKYGLLFVQYQEYDLKDDTHIHTSEIKENQEFLKIQGEAASKIKSIDEDLYLFLDLDFSDIELEYFKKCNTEIYYN